MPRFRKKPVEIEAVRLPAGDPTDAEIEAIHQFLSDHEWESDRDGGLAIHTLEGTMRATPGDWIIRGVQGEVYPIQPHIFEATYDPVEPEEA